VVFWTVSVQWNARATDSIILARLSVDLRVLRASVVNLALGGLLRLSRHVDESRLMAAAILHSIGGVSSLPFPARRRPLAGIALSGSVEKLGFEDRRAGNGTYDSLNSRAAEA
jgi:hypothetical protein